MSGVGKLKAMFESGSPSEFRTTADRKGSEPVIRVRPPSTKQQVANDDGVSTPWGIKLRPVISRSRSAQSMVNAEGPIRRNNRAGSCGNEIDDSSIPQPSLISPRAKAYSRSTISGGPKSKPPLAPKPTVKKKMQKGCKSASADSLIGLPKTPDQDIINLYPSSPTFPRKTPSPSKEEAQQASPAANSLSPTSQRSSLQDATTTIEEGPVTVQEEAKERSVVIDSQKIESSLYQRRKPQSPLLTNLDHTNVHQTLSNSSVGVPNATSTTSSDTTVFDNLSAKKDSLLNTESRSPNSCSSTPMFGAGSPLMSNQMIDELFERSKSISLQVSDMENDNFSPEQLLEYSCSPSKLNRTGSDAFDLTVRAMESVSEKDEMMFSLDTDSGNQVRISDISSEYDGVIKSPEMDRVQNGSASPITPGSEQLTKFEKDRRKRYNIAKELLETEKAYASRLKLITEDFRGAISELNSKGKPVVPDHVMSHVFLNVRQIYSLSQQILSDLQKRMDNWEEIEEIGDVLSTLAPFLKTYSIYTSGFEDAIKTLTEWTNKEKKFDALVKEFERQQVICQGLGIADFMLEPVQRIPRYKLLLESYLQHLEEDSPERQKTEVALSIIREAANNANSKIHQLENTNDILSIQRSLVEWDSPLLIPSRRFIKKGLLLKCARKNTQQRMFFLFNDMLLHAVPSGGDTFKLRNELPLYGMSIREPKISSVMHSFHVISTARSLQLAASSAEEKAKWVTTLNSSIRAETQKRRSLKRESLMMTMRDERFAMKAPVWIQDRSVSMCMVCAMPFKLMFRRHHCRGCGKVLCTNCTQWKVYLPYLRKSDRVCFECYHLGSGQQQQNLSSDATDSPTATKRNKGLLNLSGTDADDAVTAGYLHYQDGRKWTKHWYLLRRDMALYRFKAPSDVRAIESIPLPGYALSKEKYKETLLIRLKHPGATHSFRCESEEEWDRWCDSLTRACKMEFSPEPGDEDITRDITTHYSRAKLEAIESFDDTNSYGDSSSLGKRDSALFILMNSNSFQDSPIETASSNSDMEDK